MFPLNVKVEKYCKFYSNFLIDFSMLNLYSLLNLPVLRLVVFIPVFRQVHCVGLTVAQI